MPLQYYLRMPALDAGSPVAHADIRFERWLVPQRAIVEALAPVAEVSFAGQRFEILVRGRAMLAKPLLRPGRGVSLGEPLAVMYADGEDVPEDEPSSLARRA
jgi:hypothetical protein